MNNPIIAGFIIERRSFQKSLLEVWRLGGMSALLHPLLQGRGEEKRAERGGKNKEKKVAEKLGG